MSQTDRINGLTGSVAIKVPCRVGTTADITLSGLQTIDGVLLVAGDRVLVKDQATGAENGIYLASAGVWAREPDFDGARDVVKGTQVEVTDGTVNAGFFFTVSTSNPILPGITAITFTSSASAAGSAAAAAAALALTNADVVLTHADVVLTNADVVLTHADVVLTNADAVATNADAIASAASAAAALVSENAAAASAASVNLRTINSQAAGYTVATTDRNKLIEYTGAGGHSILLPLVASLGDGFEFHIKHAGTGNLTIDAATTGGVTIDGAASIVLTAGQAVVVVCNATATRYDVTQSRGYSSSAASAITFTPVGGVAATDVQSAIAELDTEKAALAGLSTQTFSVATATAAEHAAQAADIQGQKLTAFTTGGTGTAFTLTPSPAITAYAANQAFDVIFNAACGAAPTIDISGLGATVNLVRQNSDGTYTNLVANSFPSGWQSRIKLVSTTQAVVLSLPPRKITIQATRDMTAATGSVAYTGFGGKPKSMRITAAVHGSVAFSWGDISSIATQKCLTENSTGAASRDDAAAVTLNPAVGAVQTLVITSFDADGFTGTWTKINSPTGTAYLNITAELE